MIKNWIRITAVFIFLLFGAKVIGQVSFTEITSRQEMETAIAKSDSLNLPIYIDIYATWCGPCKLMDRQTFTDRTVGELLNKEFLPLRMDGESEYGSYFAYQYQLEGYPSGFIFAPGGELITRLVGFMSPEDLIGKLRSTRENYEKYSGLKKQYDEGSLSGDKFSEFISVLVGLGKEEEAETVAGQYINSIEPDRPLTMSDIRTIAYYVSPDMEIWKRLVSDPEVIRQALDTSYSSFVSSVFYRSVLSGIQENDISKVDAFTAYLPVLTEGSELDGSLMTDLAYIQFYYYTMELDSLFSYIDTQYAGARKSDDTWLFNVASQIIDLDQQFGNPDIFEKARQWFESCLEINVKFEYVFYSGMCSYMLGDTDLGIEKFKKAKELASEDSEKELIENVFNAIDNQ